LWRLALGDGGLPDFLAVFIEAGEKKNFLTEAASRPRDDVGDDFFVGMAEVWLAIDVINRGGDVKPFAHVENSVRDKCGIGNPAACSHLQAHLPRDVFQLQCPSAVADNQPGKAKPHDN
jgi:hypothetical protein